MPNARGLREAGFAPGHGPGYETLDAADPPAAATPAASPRRWPPASCRPIWLNYADPVRYHPDRPLWEQALGTAQTVIAVDTVLTDSVREYADVVFPGEAYPEKEGTVTNVDGRVQRLRPAIGRAKGRAACRARRAAGLAGDRRRRRAAAGLDLARAERRDGVRPAVRRGAVLRGPDARRASAAAASAGRSAARRGAPAGSPRGSTCRRAAPAAARRRAAARHVPQPVGRQDRRRLAAAAVPAREADRRAVARGRRARSASARATASRSAPTARA